MSYINEALKKAQELKDSTYDNYFISSDTVNKRNGHFGRKTLLYSMSVVILAVLFFFGYLWMVRSHDKGRGVIATNAPGPAMVENSPLDKKQLYERASGLYKTGRVIEAKKLFQEALGLDPGYIEALNNLGIIYIHEKNFNAARENLEKAVMLNPSYVESYYNLACLYAIKGEIDQGVEYLRKAIALDANVREWAGDDSDLQNLKRSDAFNKLMTPG
jgi:tetratricopeptide (TPR) repeat protein